MGQTGATAPEDRRAAGRLLVADLGAYASRDTVVLGITRGGLVVAHEVARLLHMPMDALVVQRIAEPGEPHLGLGAVAEPGHLVVSRHRLRALALTAAWLRQAVTHGLQEAEQRGTAYRGARPPRELAGRRVILVDDSASTGATLRVAVRAVRARGARQLVVAVPVAPTPVLDQLRGQVDRIVCPLRPADLIARGIQYPAPLELSDKEMRALLEQDTWPPGEPTGPIHDQTVR
jgi:putative phosphoribosyl transferase